MAIRMLVTLAVTLYTSRVVLQQLGVTDFGIYSVVAGLAIIMSFFTYALASAIQRYMSVELAVTGGRKMQNVFSACWATVFIMAALFLILAEGVGMWFLNYHLNIPPGRIADAHIVFQLSLAIVLIEMLRVPYNSLIISLERMSFYAYNSIFEVLLKLATAILLTVIAGDKLIIYMFLLVCVALIINVTYVLYCRHILPDVHFSVRADRKQIVEIGKFASWNILSSLSDISYQQGTSMILNVFFGVTFNASMGIANQVKSAVGSFTRSLQTAANPQIIMSFSSGNKSEFIQLFLSISKFSFYCMSLLAMPILFNTEYILELWLTVIPPQGAVFVQLMVVYCVIDSLVGPLWVTMQASGRIALYQVVISVIWLMSLPLTYLAYKLGMAPYSLITVIIAIDILLIFIRVKFTQHECGVPAGLYFRSVIVKVILVMAIALVAPVSLLYMVEMGGLTKLFVTTVLWCACLGASIYLIGLTDNERSYVRQVIKKFLHR